MRAANPGKGIRVSPWMGNDIKECITKMLDAFETQLLNEASIKMPYLILLPKEVHPGNGAGLIKWASEQITRNYRQPDNPVEHKLWEIRIVPRYFQPDTSEDNACDNSTTTPHGTT